jgi:hypothetical protein
MAEFRMTTAGRCSSAKYTSCGDPSVARQGFTFLLQGSELSVGKTLRIFPLKGGEDGLRIQPRIRAQLLLPAFEAAISCVSYVFDNLNSLLTC